MEASTVPEPQQLRDQALSILEKHPEAAHATPHSGADPLAIVYGNRLARYLWTDQGWGIRLTDLGWDLPGFMRVMGNKRRQFLRWIRGEIQWKDYLAALGKDVFRPRGQS